MTREEEVDEIIKYRTKLIECGKKVIFENPDRLSVEEIDALTQRILTELNNLDVSFGMPSHQMNFRNHRVDRFRVEEMYMDFLDWYDIVKSPANALYDYVRTNYPVKKYKKILCVGDGKCSHIGRKLASIGYDVVSVDPEADKKFKIARKSKDAGRLHIVRGSFISSSEPMIEWADLIIGPKVPQCAEEFIDCDKEAVFTISRNPEIHDMRFRGVPVTSEKVLVDEIKKCKGIQIKKYDRYLDGNHPIQIFVSKPVQKDKNEREDEEK